MLVVLAATATGSAFVFTVFGIRSCILDSTFFALITLATLVGVTLSHFILDLYLVSYLLPYRVYTVTICESFKYTITSNHDEIKVVLDLESFDIWVTDDYIWVSTISGAFGLDITEGLWDRESAWEDPQWSLNVQVLLTRVCCRFGESLSPVDFATCGLDPDLLEFVIWLMVTWKNTNLGASIDRHHRSWITNVDYVYHIVDNHYNCCTWPRSLWSHILTCH